jgi:hypothetical protein
MTTTLRAVLNAFESRATAISLSQLSRELGIAPALLESMLAYWVHKGRLREAAPPTTCNTCGAAKGCPFIMKMPRMYELVTTGEADDSHPPCACCG